MNEHAFVGIKRESRWHRGEQRTRHTFLPRHHQVDSGSIVYHVKSVSEDNTKPSRSLLSALQNGILSAHSFPCGCTASCPGIHASFLSIIVTHRHIKQSLFKNPIIQPLHTACRRMNIAVSRASCTSCNADGKPGASLSPSFLTTPTRTFSSSGRIRLKSKSRETGTRQIHSKCPLIPYVRFRESFPTAHTDELVPFLLNITGRSISLSLGKVILRKLFVAVCHLFFAPNIIH
jgi:hypothetical protein